MLVAVLLAQGQKWSAEQQRGLCYYKNYYDNGQRWKKHYETTGGQEITATGTVVSVIRHYDMSLCVCDNDHDYLEEEDRLTTTGCMTGLGEVTNMIVVTRMTAMTIIVQDRLKEREIKKR